jgi:hypothetical protein
LINPDNRYRGEAVSLYAVQRQARLPTGGLERTLPHNSELKLHQEMGISCRRTHPTCNRRKLSADCLAAIGERRWFRDRQWLPDLRYIPSDAMGLLLPAASKRLIKPD